MKKQSLILTFIIYLNDVKIPQIRINLIILRYSFIAAALRIIFIIKKFPNFLFIYFFF